jgi:N-acetyl-alpha-D-glucosaminyl L-malate synthase BshA
LDFFSENIFYHEVIVSSYPLFDYQPYEILLASKLVDVVKHEKLDLLHVHYAIPHASAAYLAKQILKSHGISIPFITTLHGTDITLVGKDASFEPVISFSINESDAVTAVSQSLKDDTYKFFDIKKEIHVIPNFISISDFEQLKNKEEYNGICQKKMYSPTGEKILMHISNFRKVKRLDDVIGIFENVRKQIPSKLLLIGDGPERNRIEQLCREKNIYRDVKFLGKITTPEMLLRVADLFLLPSETESFGLAALEAMAMNVPVISTNTGGLPEVNINAVSGYTSNVGDVEDMSQNALKILSDPLILQKFRRQAFEVAQQFDLPKILPLYEDLYKEVIEKNKESVKA